YPTIRAGIVSPACVQIAAIISRPDNHFIAAPHCCVKVSTRGRIGRGGSYPTIRAGIVSPAGVQIAAVNRSTPDNHFTAAPYCRVKVSDRGRVCGAGGYPTVSAGIVSPARVQERRVAGASTPHNHSTACLDDLEKSSARG